MKNIQHFLLCCLAITISLSCQKNPNFVQQTQQKEAAAMPQPEPIRLVSQSVHYISLPFDYTATDEQGANKTYKSAWLVRFNLENMPKNMGPSVSFFIGDYQVPEYGGTEDGIYFKIYELAQLENLRDGEISISDPHTQKKSSTKQKFKLDAAPAKMQLENEKEVLRQKN